MSSIMRRRRGLNSAISLLLFQRLRFNSRNPSKQKPQPQTEPPNAASAASFNLEASVRSASRPRGQAHRRTSLQAGLNGGAGRSGAMGIVAWRSGRDRLGRGFEEPWGGRDGEGHLGGSRDAY